MRRLGSPVLALVLASVLAPAAGAKTIKVNWHEQTAVADGAIKFHITKIVATTGSWAVTATIQNASRGRLALEPRGRTVQVPVPPPRPVWANGMALIEAHRVFSVSIGGYLVQWWQHPATTFRPALPAALAPGASWTGTFGGRSKLRKGQAFSVGFGLFVPQSDENGGRTLYWITDHSFTL